MKINKLILTNIGAYYGSYEFDLQVNDKGHVILFGGKNGAGKTTILESTRIALFGAFAYGFRGEGGQYQKRLFSLFNRKAIATGENMYQVALEYEQVENHERNIYLLQRRWELTNKSKPKEFFHVQKNGEYLSEAEVDVFESKLQEELPPQLFQFCLFDGEEVSRIATDDKLSEYIERTAVAMFNLDLFESLEKDLAQLRKSIHTSGKPTKEKDRLRKLSEEIEILQYEREKVEREIENWTGDIEKKKEQILEAKKDFELNGGLIKEEREQLLSQIGTLEQQRKENAEKVKYFTTELLPMYLIKPLITEVQKQMEKEQSYEMYTHLEKVLQDNPLYEVVKALQGVGMNTDDEEQITQVLRESFLQALKPQNETLIHRASFTQRSQVEVLLGELNKADIPELLRLIEENNILLKEVQALRKQVVINDSTHQFKDILEQIQTLSHEIEKLKLRIEQQKSTMQEKETELSKKVSEYNSLEAKVLQQDKSTTAFAMSKEVIEVSKRFRALQMHKKLKQVELEATQMIKKLLRKENFIARIVIHPETFELSLFSHSGEEINRTSLSAGEREILLLGIIWAIIKCSRRRLPFIFDTLLGRLDSTHKKTVLAQFIPICSEQVIILSTDSEIDAEHYRLLEPLVAQSYTIEYNMKEEKVYVEKGQYFHFHHTEVLQ